MLDGHAITLSIGLTRTGVKAADIKRFWSKVDKSGECWLWTASRKPNGYGQFTKKPLVFYAHRVAYEATYGPIPDGLNVCHRCDNPPCVRPDHLFIGTPLQNAQDKVAKGRGGNGWLKHSWEASKAKLTPTQVLEVRRAFARGATRLQLAATYDLTPDSIGRIVTRKTYRDVVDDVAHAADLDQANALIAASVIEPVAEIVDPVLLAAATSGTDSSAGQPAPCAWKDVDGRCQDHANGTFGQGVYCLSHAWDAYGLGLLNWADARPGMAATNKPTTHDAPTPDARLCPGCGQPAADGGYTHCTVNRATRRSYCGARAGDLLEACGG